MNGHKKIIKEKKYAAFGKNTKDRRADKMTLKKGYTQVSVKKSVQERLKTIRKIMEEIRPDKYDETTSYNTVIDWILDDVEEKYKIHITKT